MKETQNDKAPAGYSQMLKVNELGKLSQYLFDLMDKRGILKLYQGKDFIISDTQFNTEKDTLYWQHINEAFMECSFMVKGNLYQSQSGLFEQQLYSPGYHNWLFNPDATEGNQLIGKGEYRIVSVYMTVDKAIRLFNDYVPELKEIPDSLKQSRPWIKQATGMKFSERMLYLINNLWNAPNQSSLQSLYFESVVHQLFCQQCEAMLFNLDEDRRLSLKKEDIEKLQQAAEILSKNFNDPPSLKALARECGLNEYKLKKDFRQLFGISVMNYVQEQRMSLAKDLIVNTDKTISEIAYELGYAHSQHFYRAFKKRFGVVPRVFKN